MPGDLRRKIDLLINLLRKKKSKYKRFSNVETDDEDDVLSFENETYKKYSQPSPSTSQKGKGIRKRRRRMIKRRKMV